MTEEIRELIAAYALALDAGDVDECVRLFTAVYVPKDATKTYPILMTRTPYSVAPYGVDQYKGDLGPTPLFGKEGYVFVYQDVRGRWMSEGELVNMRPHNPEKRGPRDVDESSDTYDTIDWLLKRVPNHNGKVGLWGISYPGFYTSCGVIDAHPALVCASPQAPTGPGIARSCECLALSTLRTAVQSLTTTPSKPQSVFSGVSSSSFSDAVAPFIELYALITSHAFDSVTAFSNASRYTSRSVRSYVSATSWGSPPSVTTRWTFSSGMSIFEMSASRVIR